MIDRFWKAYGAWKLARQLGSPWWDILRAQHSKAGEVVVRSRLGPLTVRPRNSDLKVIQQVFVDKEYDFSRLAQFQSLEQRYHQILAAGATPVIVDAGANIGASALWFSNLFPQAIIVAIEPDPDNAALARTNTLTRSNIRVVEAAIGSQPGQVSLVQGQDGWAVQTTRAESGLPIMTVLEAVQMVQGGQLLIVKVDIEGFEADLFESDLDWVDQASAIFVEPHDWLLPGKGTSQNLQRAFFGRGRELVILGENLLFI